MEPLKSFFAAVFLSLLFFILPIQASQLANDLKGSARIIDVNNTFRPTVPSNLLPKVISIDKGLISLRNNDDFGFVPWIIEHDQTTAHFILNDDIKNSHYKIDSFGSRDMYRLNSQQVVYFFSGGKQLSAPEFWISDGTSSGTRRWTVGENLVVAHKEKFGSFSPFDKLTWGGELSNGKTIIGLDKLWSFDRQTKAYTLLTPEEARNVLVIGSDNNYVVYQVSSSFSDDKLYRTDGTVEGTTELLSYGFFASDDSLKYGVTTSGALSHHPYIEQDQPDNFFFYIQDIVNNKYQLKYITNGNISTIFEHSSEKPDETAGIVETAEHIFFVASKRLYKYTKSSGVTLAIEKPDNVSIVYRIKVYKSFGDQLFVRYDNERADMLPSYFYSFDINQNTFLNVTNNGTDEYLGPNILASDEDVIYFNVASANGGNTGYLLKYTAANKKMTRTPSVTTSIMMFIHNQQLYKLGTLSIAQQNYALYQYNQTQGKWSMAFMPDMGRYNEGSAPNAMVEHQQELYFTANITSWSELPNASRDYDKALWKISDGQVQSLVVTNINPRMVSGDKLYFQIDFGGGYDRGIYSYDNNAGVALVFADTKEFDRHIREIEIYQDGKLFLDMFSLEFPYAYINVATQKLIGIDFQPKKQDNNIFSCGNNVFISDGPELWHFEDNTLTALTPFSDNTGFFLHNTAAAEIMYLSPDRRKLLQMNCDTLQSKVVFDIPEFNHFEFGRFAPDNGFYFQLTATNQIGKPFYHLDLTNQQTTLVAPNMDIDLESWQVTRKGVYRFQSYSGDRPNEILKLIDGEFSVIKTMENHFTYLFDDWSNPDGWIFGIQNNQAGKQKVTIYMPDENQLHQVDLAPNELLNSAIVSQYVAGKSYFTYKHHKLGLELAEVDHSCLKQRLLDNQSCSDPLKNQPPKIMDMIDTTVMPDQNVYLPLKHIDPDFDTLSFSLSGHPQWLSIDSNGFITGVAPASDNNTYQVQVLIDDSKIQVASNTFELNVQNDNTSNTNNGGDTTTPDNGTSPPVVVTPPATGASDSGSGGTMTFYLMILGLCGFRRLNSTFGVCAR